MKNGIQTKKEVYLGSAEDFQPIDGEMNVIVSYSVCTNVR